MAEEGTALVGYAGMMFTGGSQADVVTLAVNPVRWGEGLPARHCSRRSSMRADQARRRGRSCWRCGRTIPGPGSCTWATGSPRSGSGVATTSRPASTPWSCGRRLRDGVPAGAWHRDVLRRDGCRAGPRARPARGFRRLERGRARAVRRRGARGSQPGAPGGDGPAFDRAIATTGHGQQRSTRWPFTANQLAGALLVGVYAVDRHIGGLYTLESQDF